MLSVIMLNVSYKPFMLSGIALIGIMPNVAILSVVVPFFQYH